MIMVKTGMSQLNVVTNFSRSLKGRDAFTGETGSLCGGTNTDGLTKDIGELTQPPIVPIAIGLTLTLSLA